MRYNQVRVAAKLRITVSLILGLFLLWSLYYSWTVWRKPALVTRKVPVYSYDQKGEFGYSVQIKPNSIIPVNRLGPGQTYFTQLVQSIDALLSYSFKAEQAASLKATYSVVAVVDSPGMWKKEFTLVPPTDVQAEGNNLSIQRPFSIDLSSFNNFLKTVNRELGASASDPQLIIKAPIAVKAVSPKGTTGDQLMPAMKIPLGQGSFMVEGALAPSKRGALTVAKNVADTGLGRQKMLAIILPSGLILLLILFLGLTTRKKEESVVKRETDLFKKSYGGRMVQAGRDFLPPDDLLVISLASCDELGKVADELGKPIIYLPPEWRGGSGYLVVDGLTAYLYTLTDQGSVTGHMEVFTAGCRREEEFS